jgi:hypothetical protein
MIGRFVIHGIRNKYCSPRIWYSICIGQSVFKNIESITLLAFEEKLVKSRMLFMFLEIGSM